MTNAIDRRQFLGAVAAAGLATVPSRAASARSANDAIVVGVMGVGSRGLSHATSFAGLDGVEVAYVCDPDSRRVDQAVEAVSKKGSHGRAPKGVADFRKILDDKAVDALIVATCNHWHAPAAILACAAGKHVYVEKPCSHNPKEGEILVASARKHDRVVQMGKQRRSWPKIIEAIDLVKSGGIGRPYYAKCLYNSDRPSIGHGQEQTVPSWLDFDLWQGPAPRQAYRDNILHYNWHWFSTWGNGELGNNGVHMIDLARWGLGVDYPSRVVSSGGRYRFDDDQETPDTHVVSFDFADRKTISWEGLSCNEFRPGGPGADVIFYGENGSLEITEGGYVVRDLKGKPTKTVKGPGGDAVHQENFLAAIRGEAKPNSEIEGGHQSTLLCHLGNIAQRTGRTLHCDPANGNILNDPEAAGYWTRDYADGWEPRLA